MNPPLRILVLTDTKPGHENQSLGLVEAIDRLTPVEHSRLKVDHNPLVSLFSSKPSDVHGHSPDLIVGAGHSTHPPLLKMARKNGASCVVLMKPSLPLAFFDLCLVPEHDFSGKQAPPNVVTTKGALNRVPPPGDQPRRSGLILIGGPSANHDWDPASVRQAVHTIVSHRGELPWRITDSRRTPDGELAAIGEGDPALITFPHGDTGPEWLPQRLAEASEVWVTEDSVSMIYEALSSGARVGLIPVPRKKPDSRVTRGVDSLIADHWVTPFTRWTPGHELPEPPAILRESERCARIVLEQFFPDRLT